MTNTYDLKAMRIELITLLEKTLKKSSKFYRDGGQSDIVSRQYAGLL